MNISYRFKILFLALFPAALFACSNSNSDAPPANAVHEAAYVLNHGSDAQGNLETCKVCHGATLTGNGSAPSCYTCHFGPDGSRVPPGSSWVHGTSNHVSLFASGDVCNACHEIMRTATGSPASCHNCHLISHPLGEAWMNKTVSGYHGDVKLAGTLDCTPCHGTDYKGGAVGVSCFTCHFNENGSRDVAALSWVHATAVSGGVHTAPAGLATYGDVCNACHDTNRTYSNPPTSCHDCHLDSPHPLGQPWMDKTVSGYHGDVKQAGTLDCTPCHGADYLGGATGVGCFTCHFDENGSRDVTALSWVHATAVTSGDHTRPTGLSTYGDVCNGCHNTNRAYSNPPTSCHDCHATHELGAAWLLPSAHATQAIADVNACYACHDLLTGGSGTQPACRTCHTASDPKMVLGTCSSCHGSSTADLTTDAGRPTGSVTPNRAGRHSSVSAHRVACSNCHNGFGTATAGHWYPDPTPPADVVFAADINLNYTNGTCAGDCHGEGHNFSWY